MEREVRLQVPVTPAKLKAIKLLAAGRDTSIAELVRAAIEAQYGDDLRAIERSTRRFMPSVLHGGKNDVRR